MKFLSVCSGIEAASVAWKDWEAVGFSEIESFPSAVLKFHYPDVPNFGDMTKFEEWPHADINVLVGGTPCQSFSVAGLRKGLADPRGNLMLTFGAIANRYRPKWLVWENVPGVLSSNGGRDFGTFLGMLGELGYGFAYRVLDAQYFGVAQRRRRVFVVGCFGDWRSAAAVLFERHSLSGHPAPSRETGKEVAGTFTARAKSGGWGQDPNLAAGGYMQPVAKTLTTGTGMRFDFETDDFLVSHTLKGEGFDASEDGTGRGTPLIPISVEVADTLGVGANQTTGVQSEVVALNIYGGNKRADRPEGGFYVRTDEDTSKTLDAATGLNPVCSQGGTAVMQSMQVRRLTPVECERLQGFPDGYTNIPWRGKSESSDGPRYKALGNSMAVPVMRWIGQRLEDVDRLTSSQNLC